jgi:hypothetical protein
VDFSRFPRANGPERPVFQAVGEFLAILPSKGKLGLIRKSLLLQGLSPRKLAKPHFRKTPFQKRDTCLYLLCHTFVNRVEESAEVRSFRFAEWYRRSHILPLSWQNHD